MEKQEMMERYDDICDLIERNQNDIPSQSYLARSGKRLQAAQSLEEKQKILFDLQAELFSVRLDLKDTEREVSALIYELEQDEIREAEEDGMFTGDPIDYLMQKGTKPCSDGKKSSL